jgi:hypothetical protein
MDNKLLILIVVIFLFVLYNNGSVMNNYINRNPGPKKSAGPTRLRAKALYKII